MSASQTPDSRQRPATVPEVLELLAASLVTLATESTTRNRWLRFGDDISIPDGADPYAELSFKAGYVTAIRDVEFLISGMQSTADELAR